MNSIEKRSRKCPVIRIALVALCTVFAVITVGCTSKETRSWKETQAQGTITAYERFIREFPTSGHVTEARAQLSRLFWDAARADNSAAAYENFLKAHSDSEFAQDARTQLQILHFPLTKQGYVHLRVLEGVPFRCQVERREGGLGAAASVRAYEAVVDTQISADDLRSVFGWDGVGRLHRVPGDETMAGVRYDANGDQVTFGTMCLGNIQFTGPVKIVPGRVTPLKGTVLVHQKTG